KLEQGTDLVRQVRANRSINLYGSSVVTKDETGKPFVDGITSEGRGGAFVGAFIGGLAGLPAGPLAAIVGAAGGAVIGGSADALSQRSGAEFAEKVSRQLAPGSAAIVTEVADDGVTSFTTLMEALGATVARR